jgi:hypothetical protein
LPRDCPAPRHHRRLKAATRPDSPDPIAPSRRAPLASCPTALLVEPPAQQHTSRPPQSEAASPGPRPRPPRRSPVAIAPCRRPRAGKPPVPRRLPCAGAVPPSARRAVPSPSRAAAMQRVRRTLRGPAERGFGPEALKLFFLFSEYIQFLANSKFCVEFI